MMRSNKLATGIVAALTLGSVGSAYAQQLVGANFTGNTIYDIDKTTGATSNVRPTGLRLIDIAFSPVTGVLYGVSASVDAVSTLYTINLTNGAPTSVGLLNIATNPEGDLAFNAAGTLYGINSNGALYTVSLTTGVATVLSPGSNNVDDVSGLFFAGSSLYAIDDRGNVGGNALLYQLNPANGAVLTTTTLNVDPPGSLTGAEIDPSTGTIYVALAGSSVGTLYTLNIGTSALTAIGTSAGLNNASGITFGAPEPASLAVFALTATIAFRRQRRA